MPLPIHSLAFWSRSVWLVKNNVISERPKKKLVEDLKQPSIFEAIESEPCIENHNRHGSAAQAAVSIEPREEIKPVREYKIEFSANEVLLKQVEDQQRPFHSNLKAIQVIWLFKKNTYYLV